MCGNIPYVEPVGRGKSPHGPCPCLECRGLFVVAHRLANRSELHGKRATGLFRVCLGDEKTTQLYGDYFINHDKDPY